MIPAAFATPNEPRFPAERNHQSTRRAMPRRRQLVGTSVVTGCRPLGGRTLTYRPPGGRPPCARGTSRENNGRGISDGEQPPLPDYLLTGRSPAVGTAGQY